jgi:hypothetical protein
MFVTNEVGMGIVPENRLARSFRDAQGRLNQDMAEVCHQGRSSSPPACRSCSNLLLNRRSNYDHIFYA